MKDYLNLKVELHSNDTDGSSYECQLDYDMKLDHAVINLTNAIFKCLEGESTRTKLKMCYIVSKKIMEYSQRL